MKLTFRTRRPPSDAAGVQELDVTPVMNVFVILIPFLVSMAVFTHMSIIEFSLPPNVGASMANSSEKPQPRLTVRIGNDFLGIAMGDKLLDSLPVISHNFPFDTLGSRLKVHKAQMNYNDEIVVASLDNIAFKYVVRVMDLCREAGFPSVGLSSAVENSGVGL